MLRGALSANALRGYKPAEIWFIFSSVKHIVFVKNIGNFCEILGILSSPLAGLF